MNGLPRLAVISQTIPETRYAGSLLLYRLLLNYPAEQILVIGPQPQRESEVLACKYKPVSLPFDRIYRTRFASLARSLGTFGLWPGIPVSKVERLVADFNPEVVLSVMQVQPYYHAAQRFAEKNGLPLALIIHDIPEEFEPVYDVAQRRQQELNAGIYRAARARFCISPEMAEKLRQTYGADGDVLYPNRSETSTPRAAQDSAMLKRENVLTIGYAGSLGYGYGEQLGKLADVLGEARACLRVYSATAPDFASEHVQYVGYSREPETTWAKIKDECDIVVLPYTWSESYRSLYQTHFPSKLPEYLALRMPVLVVGPDYATGVRWATRHPEAIATVTRDARESLIEVIARLREDHPGRAILAREAFAAGEGCFDPEQIRRSFLERLKSLSLEGTAKMAMERA